MTNRAASSFFVVILLACSVPLWSAPMPRGSFLLKPAYSAAQLAAQVKTSPVVARRYERHYGVPASEWVNYAQTQLGLRKLAQAGSYRVFFIKKDGRIGSGVRKLRKGTAVFVHLRTSTPVLLAECGNPMGVRLPGYAPPTKQNTSSPQTSGESTLAPEALDDMLPPPISSMAPDVLEDPVMLTQLDVSDAQLWDAPSVLMMPDLPASQGSAFGYGSPALLTPMFAVGLSGLIGGSSGRGGITPPAVPEPASLVLWVAAGGALLSIRQVRRKNARRVKPPERKPS
jgi:hypothetical protein